LGIDLPFARPRFAGGNDPDNLFDKTGDHGIPALKTEAALQMEAILSPIADKITDNAGQSLVN
jgi:hypothetical protein